MYSGCNGRIAKSLMVRSMLRKCSQILKQVLRGYLQRVFEAIENNLHPPVYESLAVEKFQHVIAKFTKRAIVTCA